MPLHANNTADRSTSRETTIGREYGFFLTAPIV